MHVVSWVMHLHVHGGEPGCVSEEQEKQEEWEEGMGESGGIGGTAAPLAVTGLSPIGYHRCTSLTQLTTLLPHG